MIGVIIGVTKYCILGQHMYVPASDTGCNTLNANIGSSSTATTSAFTIMVRSDLEEHLVGISHNRNS